MVTIATASRPTAEPARSRRDGGALLPRPPTGSTIADRPSYPTWRDFARAAPSRVHMGAAWSRRLEGEHDPGHSGVASTPDTTRRRPRATERTGEVLAQRAGELLERLGPRSLGVAHLGIIHPDHQAGTRRVTQRVTGPSPG